MSEGGGAKPHFQKLEGWDDAEPWVGFEPRRPSRTEGRSLESLAVFVRDHRLREVGMERRTLEAHYGSFALSQSRPGVEAARRAVVETRYGQAPRVEDVNGCEARSYPLGPEPEPGDIDPRSPAVVVWADGDRFFLLASGTLAPEALLAVARSVR